MLTRAKEKARKILQDNEDKLKYLVEMLIERENLNGEEINAVMKGEKLQPKEIITEKKEEVKEEIKASADEKEPVVEKTETDKQAEQSVQKEQEQKRFILKAAVKKLNKTNCLKR